MREPIRSAALWVWKWRWVFVLNAYLLSPIVVYQLHSGDHGAKKTVLFVAASSVLWLATLQLWPRSIWITHAVLFPLYLTVGVDLYVIANYDMRLASSMILTIVENFGDAKDFVISELRHIAPSIALILVGYGYALHRIRNLRLTSPRWLVAFPLAGIVAVYGTVLAYLGTWATVILNDRGSPFGVVPQSILAASIFNQEIVERERARSFHFGATRASAPEEPETYVLVVGESARRHDWSLYGYPRETNPRLSKCENLVVFQDVLTQIAQTQYSVPLIITRGRIDEPEKHSGEKSILSVFHEVGFRTYWLSTQERETAMVTISRYSNEADVTRFFERKYDGALVGVLDGFLQQSGNAEKKSFYLLHTLGSHFNLTSRYPREFARFPDGQSSLLGATSASMTHADMINAYDDTILYTDYFLSELIETLRRKPGIKALLYVPDHGDNLRDDARELFGHGHSNEYDTPIPMLFWYSNEFAARYPDKIASVKANAGKPLNTRNVFYSLTDMAGISLDDPDLHAMSVFGPDLVRFKRMVFKQPVAFDFDEWMSRTGTKIPRLSPPN